ncbi:4Fe-4S ferredoxin [Clostridium carboxidivorans P7]|uniref:4Fe-4S ferredoxin iron-sulfur binding domain protein n=1 Tax=Clostridium carboxidivorans P7 TaxID=536227 RepID=C6PTD9_9CLOT|nr:EFR1 family ferrodoxin [Clostridium carboxidivorans]AKN33750.1 4Fe-4S ferredoxin [Clostridium carboxidivorans P7]EET87462.1 4Fe-4S ferredoxin iron-sulfur binding domain protein [Clostridium carboxidivorans P7]EFG86646.1 4Fe-4S binding domain protein [Clostridium carboxidivorans P7]
MKIFYFTATGNSLYVAKRFEGELYSIPKVLKSNKLSYEDEKIGIIFPCYGFTAPGIVREFIEKVTLKSPYIFAILTYGNKVANGAGWFADYAKKNNVTIHYANSLLMIDNYLPIFDIEQQKLKSKNIEENLNRLLIDVSKSKKYIDKGTLLDSFMSNGIDHLAKVISSFNSVKNFSINDKCNGCGTCIKVCPRDNLSIDKDLKNSKPVYGDTCEFCLACINLCPKKAIKLKREKNPNARFKNENVTLKEIIDSNS